MADQGDPEISRRYRELGSEEPSSALDLSILEASRRAVASRPRWPVPLAAAAVVVLAVGVAVFVEREQPDPQESQEPPRELIREAPSARGEREFRVQEVAPGRQRAPVPQTAPVQPATPTPQAAPAPEISGAIRSTRKPTQADSIEESPERWLERIARLRKAGEQEEADKALAEFRQRYPHYKIPDDLTKN
jgi:hypothetical protein